jgi:hypothetical protein
MNQVPGQTVSAGWYPDPGMPGQQRYWDGARWTTNTAPVGAVPVPDRRMPGQWLSTPAIVAIAIVLLLVFLGLFAAYQSQRSHDQVDDQVHRDYCDSFGQDDPDCF